MTISPIASFGDFQTVVAELLKKPDVFYTRVIEPTETIAGNIVAVSGDVAVYGNSVLESDFLAVYPHAILLTAALNIGG